MTCLDENEALTFIRGETTADKAGRVERHVAECTKCQELLCLAVQNSLLDSRPASSSESCTLLGRRVGNFVTTGFLGRGGMGEVYLATHPEIGRQVAVKVLAVPVPEHAQRFLNEARIIAALRHPNVVEVYDFGQMEDGQLYYTMELLRGPSLGDVIRERSPMEAPEALTWIEQICAGLQAAHDAGVVHRDLKPGNIIVLQTDPIRLKLVDFGLAKLVGNEKADVGSTSPGLVLGTPQFLAPEQAAGEHERIGPRTDIYALGVVLYWMLSGRVPFDTKSPGSLVAQHLCASPPPLPDLPSSVAGVVERCLAKRPEERPSSAHEVVRDLRRALGNTRAAVGANRARGAQRWLLAALGAAMVLVSAVLVWSFRGPDSPRPGSVEVTRVPSDGDSPLEPPRIEPRPERERERSVAAPRPTAVEHEARPAPTHVRRRPHKRARPRRATAPDAGVPSSTIGEGTLPFQE